MRDYQLRCLEQILSKIYEGAKHLSVVMTTGLGLKTMSFFLVNKLCSDSQIRIAMVFRYNAALIQAKSYAEGLGIESIDFFSVKEFSNYNTKYQYVILHDLSVYDRKQVQESINGYDSITISFFSPFQEVNGENTNAELNRRLFAYMEIIAPVVCVYVTSVVVDIRDAKYAGETETIYVNSENIATINYLQQEKKQVLNERDEIIRRNIRLQMYLKALRQFRDQQKLKEQALEIERLKALLQADEKNKRIEELEAKEREYQEQLEEKDAIIEQQDQMIRFQQDVLSAFGIAPEVIRESFSKIQEVRCSLKNELESSDTSIKESALKQFQDTVAEIVSGLTQSALPKKDYKHFEEYLIGEITEEVWGRLEEKSRIFLITAKSNFESMVKMDNEELLDYSGVCLLVTKALEVETSKRFFGCYKIFLEQNRIPVSQWPYALRRKERGVYTENVITDNEFTLGSVVYVIGRKCEYDDSGNIIGYPLAHEGSKRKFIDYARNQLFLCSDQQRVEMEIEKDYHFIEKVRLDFRNPSAHKDRLTITTAKECLEYVIDVQHMLREMLYTMRI